MSQDWNRALRAFQPMSQGGAQRAGAPGMGGGSIPYAPGATQYDGQTQAPTGTSAPAGDALPQGSGYQPPAAAEAGAAGGQQQQGPVAATPQQSMMYARYLMDRLLKTMGVPRRF